MVLWIENFETLGKVEDYRSRGFGVEVTVEFKLKAVERMDRVGDQKCVFACRKVFDTAVLEEFAEEVKFAGWTGQFQEPFIPVEGFCDYHVLDFGGKVDDLYCFSFEIGGE